MLQDEEVPNEAKLRGDPPFPVPAGRVASQEPWRAGKSGKSRRRDASRLAPLPGVIMCDIQL